MAVHDLDALLAERGEREGDTVTLGGTEWELPADVLAGDMLAIKRYLSLVGEVQDLQERMGLSDDDDAPPELREKFGQLARFDQDALLRKLAGDPLYEWIAANIPSHKLSAIFWRLVAIHEGEGDDDRPSQRRRRQPQDRKPKKAPAKKRASAAQPSKT